MADRRVEITGPGVLNVNQGGEVPLDADGDGLIDDEEGFAVCGGGVALVRTKRARLGGQFGPIQGCPTF